MKGFWVGFVAALAACGLALMAWLALGTEAPPGARASEPSASVARPQPEESAPDETVETEGPAPSSAPPARPAPQRKRVGDAEAALGPGEVRLRPGDALEFQSGRVVRVEDAPNADVQCLDVQSGGVRLRLAHGGAAPPLPRIVTGPSPSSATLFERLTVAPTGMEPSDLGITRAGNDAGAILVAEASDGRAYKVILEEIVHAPEVWLRSARVRYEEIPTSDEPFVIPMPEATVAMPLSQSEKERVARLLEVPKIPDLKYGDFAQGDHYAIDSFGEDVTLSEGRQDLFIRSPLAVELNLRTRGSVVFGGGVAPKGRVKTGSYSALLVEGSVEGELETNSYTYVRVTGDVIGKINVRSYATVVVDGAVRGNIEVNSYGTLVLLGDVPDPKGSINVRSRGTLYFGRYQSEAALAEIGVIRPVLTHVRVSDLPAGEHEVAGAKVIVGDELWNELR